MASLPTWPPAVQVGSPVLNNSKQAQTRQALLHSVMEKFRTLPHGIALELLETSACTAVRFWVVDNSGSMATPDGKQVVFRQDGSLTVVRSTRWNELKDVVLKQADLALSLDCRIDFHLLNPPHSLRARQFLSLALDSTVQFPSQGELATLNDLRATLDSTPQGGTPLTEAVVSIHKLVQQLAPDLTRNQQQVVVVIATDGLPNNSTSFVQAVSDLQRLGCVWLIVRLCTQSDEVLQYWNNLDSQLEAPLEVLDDACGEAAEVYEVNPWLTYGFPLHMARESGLNHKLIDLLDEQPFIGSQVAEMISLLFGCGPLPNPEGDWIGFQERVGVLLSTNPETVCPVTKRRKPWIDLHALRSKFGRSVKRSWFGAAPDGKISSSCVYSTEPPAGVEGNLRLVLEASHLRKESWGSLTPFVTISGWYGGGQYHLIANSETIRRAKDLKWQPLQIPRAALTKWDMLGRIRVAVHNFGARHCHKLIGYCYIAIDEILDRNTAEYDLHGKSGKFTGRLCISAEVSKTTAARNTVEH